MSDAKANRGITGHLETVLKVSSIVIGVLYVLGLLISNIQLMQVGVSDFVAVQARYVLTGVLFLIYVAAPPAVFTFAALAYYWLHKEHGKSRAIAVPIAAVFGALGVVTVALVFGALYQSGPSYIDSAAEDFNRFLEIDGLNDVADLAASVFLRELASTYHIIKDTYFHFDNGLLVLVLILPLAFSRARLPGSILGIVFTMLCVIATAFVTAGFANHVYPNISFNVGGGQPRIARVYLEHEAPEHSALLVEPEGQPAVVWHIDENFVYVTTLAESGSAAESVLAIDTGAVSAMQFVDGYVVITRGGMILDVAADW